MDHYQKKLLKKGIIVPLIISFVITAGFFALMIPFSSLLPFSENNIALAEYEKADIIQAEKIVSAADGSVSKRDILPLENNTALGTVRAGETILPLIYNANEVNASGKFNLSKDGVLAGETGCALIFCGKSDANNIKSLQTGDEISVETVYGSFVYEVTETVVCSRLQDIEKSAEGIGKSLVIYTDNSSNVGIGSDYFAVVCKLTSGNNITQ